MKPLDLLILGTGSGNMLLTPEFDNAHTAIIEPNLFGGTCLNVGCIPTKMFVRAAEMARIAKESSRLGVDMSVDQVRWKDIRDRVFNRIDPIASNGRDYRKSLPNVDVYEEAGEFSGPHTVRSGATEITAEHIVIATGATPIVPGFIANSGLPFETNETIMRLEELPETLAILGGGVIAAEFGAIFAALGVKVTIIEAASEILGLLDEEIGAVFRAEFAQQVNVRAGVSLEAIAGEPGALELTLSDGSTISAEKLLVAIGRRPNTDKLSLEKAGVAVDEQGRIIVDEYGRTSAPGIWALGDAVSPIQLKHVANAQARAISHNLAQVRAGQEPDRKLPTAPPPAAIFTSPEVAFVGLTEADAVAEFGAEGISVKVQKFGDTAYGWALEDEHSVCKVIARKDTGALIGAHLVGPMSSVLIQPLITLIHSGAPAAEFAAEQYWIHPALSEVVENALLGLNTQ